MARLNEQTGRGGARGLKSSHEGRDAFTDARGSLLDSSEELVSGAAAIEPSHAPYATDIVTGGTAGSEDVTVGDGTVTATNAVPVIGQRKLYTLKTRTNGADVLNLDHANLVNAAGTAMTNCDLDAAGEFILLEWNGLKWQEIYSDATITV